MIRFTLCWSIFSQTLCEYSPLPPLSLSLCHCIPTTLITLRVPTHLVINPHCDVSSTLPSFVAHGLKDRLAQLTSSTPTAPVSRVGYRTHALPPRGGHLAQCMQILITDIHTCLHARIVTDSLENIMVCPFLPTQTDNHCTLISTPELGGVEERHCLNASGNDQRHSGSLVQSHKLRLLQKCCRLQCLKPDWLVFLERGCPHSDHYRQVSLCCLVGLSHLALTVQGVLMT